MKIVVLDGYTLNPGDLSWENISKFGELTVYDRTPDDLVTERIKDAEIVLTNKVPITAGTLKCCSRIKYIGVLATGYNVVDVKAAGEKGVIVTNIPTYGTAAVSQFAIALLLELCHHIGAHADSVMAGEWSASKDWCYWNYPLLELAGKTIGIIGFGRIGQKTGEIAQALGMNVLAYDRSVNLSLESERCKYVQLDELFAQADVIALHCPLLPETEGLINKNSIAKMKTNVLIVNNSRGPLIVEQDLAEALNSGRIGGAAVDVVSTEPIQKDNPLLGAKNMIITPHISWAPKEARQRLLTIAEDNLKMYLGGRPQNLVN